MIEAVHVLDRQAGGIQMGVVRQENGRTQSSMSDMKFVKKRTIELGKLASYSRCLASCSAS